MIYDRSVLVVDDDDLLLRTIAKSLLLAGFEVSTASNGLQGYASFFRHQTAWVVTDIQMPELSGIDMMRCVRGVRPEVKTVYISGATDDFAAQLREEQLLYGATVLAKPFALKSLMAALRQPVRRPKGLVAQARTV